MKFQNSRKFRIWGNNYDYCLSYSENTFSDCWNGIAAIAPAMHLTGGESDLGTNLRRLPVHSISPRVRRLSWRDWARGSREDVVSERSCRLSRPRRVGATSGVAGSEHGPGPPSRRRGGGGGDARLGHGVVLGRDWRPEERSLIDNKKQQNQRICRRSEATFCFLQPSIIKLLKFSPDAKK